MFWKIVLYSWIGVSVFNLFSLFAYIYNPKLKDAKTAWLKNNKNKSIIYSIFSWVKAILICSIPIFNFIFALILIFAENEIIEKAKEIFQKESEE